MTAHTTVGTYVAHVALNDDVGDERVMTTCGLERSAREALAWTPMRHERAGGTDVEIVNCPECRMQSHVLIVYLPQ